MQALPCPQRRVVARGFENLLFDGSTKWNSSPRTSIFCKKYGLPIAFGAAPSSPSTESYVLYPHTAVCDIADESYGLKILARSGRPRLYRPEAHGRYEKFPEVLLADKHDTVAIRTWCVKGESVRCKNCDGDELWYIAEGSGTCLTTLGYLAVEPDSFLFIPRNVCYKIIAGAPLLLIGVESAYPIFPVTGEQHAVPFDLNDLILPSLFPQVHPSDLTSPGAYEVHHKNGNVSTVWRYAHPLFSCVAWSGTLYPFTLPAQRVNASTTDTVHTDPHRFTVFATHDGAIMVSLFTGRRVHSLPYEHENTVDEVLFYRADYDARGGLVQKGDITFHPQGATHGPQKHAYETWAHKKDPREIPWKDERAVMFETAAKLFPMQLNNFFLRSFREIPGYWKSWIDL